MSLEPADPMGDDAAQLLRAMSAEPLRRYSDIIDRSAPTPTNEPLVPAALTSLLGGTISLMARDVSSDTSVGQVTAELNEAERNWFLAELPRAEAEHGRKRTD